MGSGKWEVLFGYALGWCFLGFGALGEDGMVWEVLGWLGRVGGLSCGKTVGSVGGGEVVEVRERWGGMMCEGMGYEGWNG